MLFLKPDVKRFVLFDLLLTASNLIFDLGLSVKRITGVISQRQLNFAPKC